MNRYRVVPLVLAMLLILCPSVIAAGKAKPGGPEVARYQRFERTFALDREYGNPFDPDVVAVDALLTGPGGVLRKVPCFYDGYAWNFRFVTGTSGKWDYRVTARDSKGTREVKGADGSFTVTAAAAKAGMGLGYVAKGKDTRYFGLSEGGTYIPIGSDVAWESSYGSFEHWFASMSKNGANFARVWFTSQNGYGLEGPEDQGFPGLGRYSTDRALEIDRIVGLGEATGIRILFTIGNYRELIDEDYWGAAGWPSNPYNAVNGGPCKTPADMWTNAAAKEYYKKRLRYIIARWGYSPAVMAWEFWNEVDAPAPWIAEMAAFVKKEDPFGHLVTTTYGSDDVWAIPDIDFTQTHIYRQGEIDDMTPAYHRDALTHAKYQKPHLLAEFGLDWQKSDAEYDPKGLATNFRHGLWASFLSGAAGSGMIWWWDNYIDPQNLYGVFAPFARFIRGLPWSDGTEPMDIGISQDTKGDALYDVKLIPEGGWGQFAQNELSVGPAGIAGGLLPGYLYSPGKAPWDKPVNLRVKSDDGTAMVLGLHEVSANNTIEVRVDGSVVWSKTFAPGEGRGEWKTSTYKSEWKIYQAVYDTDYAIPIPAGEHLVSIKNKTGDWVSLSHITFEKYTAMPAIFATGVKGNAFGAFWVHDKADNWRTHAEGKPLDPVGGLTASIADMPDGDYEVIWTDTKSGDTSVPERVQAEGGRLDLKVPAFTGEIACRFTRIR